MPFEYRGDIAQADIAFNAWADGLEELFKEAARATMQVMVQDLTAVRHIEAIELKLDQDNAEMLLFDFLNELIFYKDARRLILLPSQLTIDKLGENWRLQATLHGEEIDAARHRLNTDVKAVTLLRFSLSRVHEKWRATVVLDV